MKTHQNKCTKSKHSNEKVEPTAISLRYLYNRDKSLNKTISIQQIREYPNMIVKNSENDVNHQPKDNQTNYYHQKVYTKQPDTIFNFKRPNRKHNKSQDQDNCENSPISFGLCCIEPKRSIFFIRIRWLNRL